MFLEWQCFSSGETPIVHVCRWRMVARRACLPLLHRCSSCMFSDGAILRKKQPFTLRNCTRAAIIPRMQHCRIGNVRNEQDCRVGNMRNAHVRVSRETVEDSSCLKTAPNQSYIRRSRLSSSGFSQVCRACRTGDS